MECNLRFPNRTLIIELYRRPRHAIAMSGLLKVAVLGTGSLGKEHARIYAELAAAGKVKFVGVYDVNAEAARKIAEKHKVHVFTSVPEAIAACDAVNIVTPTITHFDLAKNALEQGRHVLAVHDAPGT